ncbi:MAG TPA: dihydrofolate reductase [Burkholderiales bacterium]
MTRRSRIALIAAVARNGVIGSGNRMPWHLPEDLKRFRRLTLGHAVIMGRRTFESIGKPLAGRSNIVVTRSPDWTRVGCHTAHSLESALAAVHEPQDAFVIGGAEIYALAFPLADRLHVTEIERDFEGDVFFPQLDRSCWREVSRERHASGGAEGFAYAFVEYERGI